MLHIEKSAFHRGEYVGYVAGYVFRVTRTNSSFGNWSARLARYNPVNPRLSNRILYAFTLKELDAKFNDLAKEILSSAIIEITA